MTANQQIELTNSTVQEWIGKDTVLHSKWSEQCDCLRVITISKKNADMQLLRFFTLGNKVQVSVDIPHRGPGHFAITMLEKNVP